MKHYIAIGLIIAVIIIVTSIIYRIVTIQPATISTSPDGVILVAFSLSRPTVLFHRECVVAHWQVDGAETVLLNGRPVPHHSTKSQCVLARTPLNLQVLAPYGTSYSYSHTVEVLSDQDAARITALLCVAFLFVAAYLLEIIRFNRPMLNALLVAWMGAAIVIFLVREGLAAELIREITRLIERHLTAQSGG